MYKLKLIPVRENSIKAGFAPKYTFQVYSDGQSGPVKQSDELVEELNMCLENTPLSISGNEVCKLCCENL